MISKYHRSFSGLPENQNSSYTSHEGETYLTRRIGNGDKLNSIYSSINTQRLAEQKESHKSNLTVYEPEVSIKYQPRNELQIKKSLNQEKVKRSLNMQDTQDSNKENINSKKINLKPLEKPLAKIKYDHTKVENNNLLRIYSNDILDYIKTMEISTTPVSCLLKHSIPSSLRSKMVDWMIEVLASYKTTEQSFFLAVRIMDQFFAKTDRIHEVSDLHLTGVTSMFMACKYEEIYPFKLQTVYEKISHKKLSVDQIKRKESEILQVIGFNLVGGTIYEIFNHLLIKVQLEKDLEQRVFRYLKKICVYLAKMILYEYELVSQHDYFLLSGSLIFVAFKIIEQIQPSFKSEQKIKEIIEVAGLTNDKLIDTASKVLNLAKNFDKHYPNLENLKKFNGFQMEDLDEEEKSKPI